MNEYLIEFKAWQPPTFINQKVYKYIYKAKSATEAWEKICKSTEGLHSEEPILIDCHKI